MRSRRNPYERRFRSYSHGLAPINVPDNALILSSATPGQVIDESGGQYSLLMAELLKSLDTPNADAEAVFSRTRVAVSRASEGEQVPTVSSSLAGDVQLRSDAAMASRKAGRLNDALILLHSLSAVTGLTGSPSRNKAPARATTTSPSDNPLRTSTCPPDSNPTSTCRVSTRWRRTT